MHLGCVPLALDLDVGVGDIAGAVGLATKVRRVLDGISRAKWVVVLNGLAGELPTFALGLKSVQRTIVNCDRLSGAERVLHGSYG